MEGCVWLYDPCNTSSTTSKTTNQFREAIPTTNTTTLRTGIQVPTNTFFTMYKDGHVRGADHTRTSGPPGTNKTQGHSTDRTPPRKGTKQRHEPKVANNDTSPGTKQGYQARAQEETTERGHQRGQADPRERARHKGIPQTGRHQERYQTRVQTTARAKGGKQGCPTKAAGAGGAFFGRLL